MRMFVPKNLGAPKPVTPAVYKALVTDAAVKTSAAGNTMLAVTFTIQSQGPNNQENTVGRKLWENYVFAENTLWKINELYKACTGEDIPATDDDGVEVDELIALVTSAIHNQTVAITVETEAGKSGYEDRSRIRKVSAL